MNAGGSGHRRFRKRYAAIAVIAVGVVFAFALNLKDVLNFDTLYQERVALFAWRDSLGMIGGPLALIALYGVGMTLSLPVGVWLTIAAGFIFGTAIGGLSALVGATIGASGLFFIARFALFDVIDEKFGPRLEPFRQGFEANGLSYMLVLRLLPVVPYWMINLACALVGVRYRTYLIGTFFGMAPASLIFASVGSGLNSLFAACDQAKVQDPNAVCQAPGFDEIMTPEILASLFGLAFLALMPVIYRRFKKTKKWPETGNEGGNHGAGN